MYMSSIVAVIIVFVAIAILSSSFLCGVILWDMKNRIELSKKLIKAQDDMNAFADVNNDNVNRMAQAITELQDKVQAHELRINGGVSRISPTVRQ